MSITTTSTTTYLLFSPFLSHSAIVSSPLLFSLLSGVVISLKYLRKESSRKKYQFWRNAEKNKRDAKKKNNGMLSVCADMYMRKKERLPFLLCTSSFSVKTGASETRSWERSQENHMFSTCTLPRGNTTTISDSDEVDDDDDKDDRSSSICCCI